MTVTEYAFELELEVRDYECDLEGVVNNAVYLNYLEHARHSYLRTRGLDFAQLHEQGCDLVMTRAEIDYKIPLRSGDRFVVRLNIGRESRLRFVFEQAVHRLPGMELALEARIIGTGIIAGRPGLPDEVQALLDASDPEFRPLT
jgi:acyl-CoA thioester hydrolase